jgi:hypothetical protein
MTTKEKSKKRRNSDEEGGGGVPPPSRKRPTSSSAEVRIKVVRPAKASSSAEKAPAALAPFVGYLAHGRLGAAAKAAQTIGGGGGGGSGGGKAGHHDADPDGTKAASKVHFDVFEAPRRAPVYVAQLAGPRKDEKKDDDDSNPNPPPQPRLLLVGRTDGAEQTGASAAGWYAVGVYSRSKGTLTLARAQDGRLARVEPVLPEAVSANAAALAKRAAEQAAADGGGAREQSKKLVDAFGSTRRKRQLQAREEGAVRSDRLLEGGAGVQAALARVNAAAAREGGTRDAVLARAAASRNIPPHDPTATTPGRAYRVRAFFPSTFWDALNSGQLLAAAEDSEQMAKLRDRRLVPGYVLSRCDALLRPSAAGAGAGGASGGASTPLSNSKDARRSRAKLLAAVAALLTLHGGRASVRVPVGPGGLEDAARRLRLCARGEALEALLELLYVPAGRVEGDGPEEVAAAAAAAAAEAEAKAKAAAAVKTEEGEAAAGGEGGEGEGAAKPPPSPPPSASKPPRTPRPAADLFVRDDRQKALALAYALVIALEAEGWRMSPEAFEALRAELRVGARDLVTRFRELGCDCVAATAAAAGEEGGAGTASYSVSLLQRPATKGEEGGDEGARTLEDAFPKAKRPAAKQRR